MRTPEARHQEYLRNRDGYKTRAANRYSHHKASVLAQQSGYKKRNRERVQQMMHANYERTKPQRMDQFYRRTYGVSLAEFDAQVVRQGGRCAGCGVEKKLVMDHDHATGKPRGALCHGCNRALGLLGEDVGTLLRLVDYLSSEGTWPK